MFAWATAARAVIMQMIVAVVIDASYTLLCMR
jgi:hypothetical protein